MNENLPAKIDSAPPVSLGTIQAGQPKELVQAASAAATELATIVDRQSLWKMIGKKKFVFCEGWTTLAAMMGVTPHEVETTEKDGVFTAIVELRRISDGQPIARASAECGHPDEVDNNGNPVWANRARYARRSMAQTRATSKACRLAFSWIMVLAGYEATPAEEVPDGGFSGPTGAAGQGGGQSGSPPAGEVRKELRFQLHEKPTYKSGDHVFAKGPLREQFDGWNWEEMAQAHMDHLAGKRQNSPLIAMQTEYVKGWNRDQVETLIAMCAAKHRATAPAEPEVPDDDVNLDDVPF